MNNTSNRLADLFRRFLKDSRTREELDELLETIERHPDDEALHRVLQEQWRAIHKGDHKGDGIPHAQVKLERLLRASRGGIRKEDVWRKNRRRFAAAAAFALILAGAAYLFFKPAASVPEPILSANSVQHDIAPGSVRATLTLVDGTTISLENNDAGTLALQGSMQVIKLDSGQLAYRPASDDIISGEIGYNTLTTPRGGQYKVTLPDGTRVWLNAESSLRYPAVFTGTERKVELTGEAYFEVTSLPLSAGPGNGNKGKVPFIVRVNGMEIKVLGTHFNVMAYEDERVIHTTLLEGSVSVLPVGLSDQGPSGKPRLLRPGQQARLANPRITGAGSGEIEVVSDVDTRQVVAWKDGYFQFEHTDLPSVMRLLARWYDVEVVYNDVDSIPDQYFGGRIPRNLPLSKLLSVLEQNEVRFRIQGRQLIIRK